jgi:Ca2+-binding RTX toxin-like protein
LVLTNYGTITASSNTDSNAFLAQGGGSRIINHGVMSATVDSTIEVYANDGNPTTITNTGTILGQYSYAIEVFYAGGINLVNSGEILGFVQAGSGFSSIHNTGEMVGGISFGNGGGTLINSGVIQGIVYANNASSLLADLRGGTVLGNIICSFGNDVFLVDQANLDIDSASVADKVVAWCDFTLDLGFGSLELRGAALRGAGNDESNTVTGNGLDNTLTGGVGDDTLNGSAGVDVLRGGTGLDSLLGGDDDDQLFGGDAGDVAFGEFGSDLLRGGAGLDSLTGGSGDDTLQGDTGNDSIAGGDDDDLLIGGRGRDVLTGGADFDTFQMLKLADSGTVVATRDVISDFATASDLIDLTRLDARLGGNDDAFAFIGSAAFGSVAGQLRFRVNGANVIVEGDVNGDGVADFSVQVNGIAALVATDFLL